MKYYKYREDNSLSTDEISSTFWNSFRMYIKRIADNDWLTEKFGYDEENGWSYSYKIEEINSRITEELGIVLDFFATTHENDVSSEDVLSLIEFFYTHISQPKDTVRSYHGEWFPCEFNSKEARYEYTIYINELLKNRKHCYYLKSGQISKVASEKLDKMYYPELGRAIDTELNLMINNSFKDFSSIKSGSIDNSLLIISNALERAKTLEGKKATSIEKIISKISDDETLKDDIATLMKLTTKISNNYMIRHYETDKTKIRDKNIKEFVYYNYLNAIRLILSTYDIEI